MRYSSTKLIMGVITCLLLLTYAPQLKAQTINRPFYIMIGISMNDDFSDVTSWVGYYNNWDGYEFNLVSQGVYSLKNVKFHATNESNESEVIISNEHGALNNIKTSLGISNGNGLKEVASGYQADLTMRQGAVFFACPPGTYNVELVWNGQNGTLNLTKPQISTGIDTLEADNNDSDAIYYDITGRQVTTPKPGIYLCRKGNKVTKVVIR